MHRFVQLDKCRAINLDHVKMVERIDWHETVWNPDAGRWEKTGNILHQIWFYDDPYKFGNEGYYPKTFKDKMERDTWFCDFIQAYGPEWDDVILS